jgi:hypothetical protein
MESGCAVPGWSPFRVFLELYWNHVKSEKEVVRIG